LFIERTSSTPSRLMNCLMAILAPPKDHGAPLRQIR
jgi:hypothetical protein